MWFGIVSLFPELVRNGCSAGVVARAIGQGTISVDVFNPRDFTTDKHRTVDDRPYGGGPGMIMLVEPLVAAIEAARAAGKAAAGLVPRVIYLSPQGRTLSQAMVGGLAEAPALVLVAGRYEGIDERVLELAVDEELSIGDYVLSGGELPALVVVDAVARLLPGTLGNAASVVEESHLDGLLDYPHYTRPETARGLDVPAVLLSGNHRAVSAWRRKMALQRTWSKRPDLLAGRELGPDDRALLREGLGDAANESVTNEG